MQFKVTLYVNKSLGGITVEGNTVQRLIHVERDFELHCLVLLIG
ncbi:hypothetical protein KAM338_50120 [Aeromonas caviae]|nr:hypothetical protein KAM338_50120 [Aeromonas caviae]